MSSSSPSNMSKPQGFYSSAFWADYLTTQHSRLPKLGDVQESCGSSKRVVRFLGGNPGHMQLQGTNTYLVGTGRSRILIDTGEGRPSWIMNLTSYLDDHDISISDVLLTHWHKDHTGGLDDLLLQDAHIHVHKNNPDPGQRPLRDGQIFTTEGATLRVVLTPGHSDDHTCFVLEEDNALFTGDVVLGHGYSVAEDLGAYISSLRLMRRLCCTGVGYPGHGDVIKNLSRVLDMYIAQRDARERQVCSVLTHAAPTHAVISPSRRSSGPGKGLVNGGSTGGLTVEDVGARLYGEAATSSDSFDTAVRPLLDQVLFMLADHGKVGSRLVGAGTGQARHCPELPSGDVQDLLRRLHRQAKRPRHALLARFLREAIAVLRQEVQALPRDQRETVPAFADVVTLGSWWESLRRGPVGAGISIGLFSAAAVAVSPTLVDLVSRGAEGVRMAFVFCRHVGRVSQLLETTITPGSKDNNAPVASWASVITGLSAEVVQEELNLFNGQQQADRQAGKTTPLTSVSISHVDHASVGVTGPPARLSELFRTSKTLASSRWAQLPISGGLCHVPNVYNAQDVRSILQGARVSDPDRWGSRPVLQPLLSPHSGTPFQVTNAAGLIEAICAEALTKPLFFDKVADGAVTQIQANLMDLSSKRPPSVLDIFRYRTSIISDNILSTVTAQLATNNTVAQGVDLVDWVYLETSADDENQGNPGLPQDSKLAVVGMACRMPGDADTPEKFWELLVQGRDTVSEVPSDRFDLDAHFDPTMEGENTVGTRFGNFVSNPGFFDAGFFNMSPREAQQTDPMQRLALVTAYEALEMAGFVPGRTPSSHPSRVGTYYGQASDDYREVNASQKIGTYGIPGTERAFGNGRINYFFNFQGPSFNVDTACSSGLAAVQAACSALWAGEADTVVAGGLNIITSPDIYCMLGRGHFLSPTGQCKVWDAGADGYCRADGVGSVVIKRLEDALADNDVVLGTILAGATNHSSESVSITQPHAGIQKDNYRRVMDRAGVSPFDVNYVELHGTGTQVGDAVESESVLDFFAPPSQRRAGPVQRLGLGGVKSNIGHGEAAAGISSLIKVLLMYRHDMIPRHIGIKTTINPVVARHLAGRNAGIVSENTPWSPPGGASRKRYAIVNSFGAHGGNTTLLLEDPPAPAPPPPAEMADDDQTDDGYQEVVCISAKSKASLRGNVAALLAYLDANPGTRLKDVAYTTSARRIHHHIRVAEAEPTTARLRELLRQMTTDDAALDAHAVHVPKQRKKVVFAFSGQGCFYRGAAASLCERAPDFADLVVQLDRVVIQLGFPSVHAAVVDPSKAEENGSPLLTQLAIVVLQIALARYWVILGILPDAVIGHSLGEYAALCTAGVLSAADALFLVGHRAQLTAAACGETGSHAMLSVRGASLEAFIDTFPPETSGYEVSCINGRADVVVSGPKDRLDTLRSTLQQGAPELKCLPLDMPYAFHSAQLDPILDDFETAARQRVTFKTPEIPVFSPLLGQCLPASTDSAPVLNETYLPRATRGCVDFVSAVGAASTAGFADDGSVWLDIGPHPVCSNFVRNCLDKDSPLVTTLPSFRKSDDSLGAWSNTLATLHRLGLPVAWDEYFSRRKIEKSRQHRLLHLETYRWNNKNYWIPYDTTWTLDKADPLGTGLQKNKKSGFSDASSFFTSSVQRVSFEDINEKTLRLTALSDLWHPDMLGAAAGHKIHGRSVLTASIWADICLTVGEHAYKRLLPHTTKVFMDVRDMQVVEAQLIDDQDPSPSQFIRIEAELSLDLGRTQVRLWAAHCDGSPKSDRAFATAVVWYYPDTQDWQTEWQTASHLVGSRIETLWDSTSQGKVSALSRQATYQLFANVVDYDIRYQGMRRAALDSDALEAAADVVLDDDRHGTWHTPPHWIDGTFQLAGLVMNSFGDPKAGSPARDFFFITPGWRRLRLTEPLQAGVQYRNYVRMVPAEGEPGAYKGDIYLLRDQTIVGLCQGIKFKRVPRALMPVMFARRGNSNGVAKTKKPVAIVSSIPPVKAAPKVHQVFSVPKEPHAPPAEITPRSSSTTSEAEFHLPHVANSMRLIAQETGLDAEDLRSDTAFADVGVDSLMSLTLADKLQAELGVPVKASLFLECPTVGDLEKWLMKQG
ncbi:putative beta-ketoacyl synthase domain-containing protein [Rhypophila decipiens]|uniref:Beta-ketoacyl synthase domain-containing protein n=1 Tax=Rhypophila decipiens TaxID=261697 RepID=A0AAN6Y0B6_9PEZI|nr:putative beta-ketoacyl synthase domain-containing protein [Rhypophila decipiens]